ncbi:MAG TPA: hypothetical protein VML75_13065 [Kofleriaceae bacterium]|nr:hypothetical protein [Kofleriaceae bacterium]
MSRSLIRGELDFPSGWGILRVTVPYHPTDHQPVGLGTIIAALTALSLALTAYLLT